MRQLVLGVRPRADAVFANFVPGGNTEVVAAMRAAGAAPLWLWGAPGSGKTHLLQAVCAAAAAPAAGSPGAGSPAAGSPGAGSPAAYFPLDRTTGLPPAALDGFEQCPVLCLDDVDAVVGHAPWETALFRLFNAGTELASRLIFAGAAAPRALQWHLPDLASRMASCIVYQLHELDDGGRIEALKLRAAQRGVELPPETSEYLLRRMPRDLPSLFEVLDQLDEASLSAQRRRLTVPFIRAALERHAGKAP